MYEKFIARQPIFDERLKVFGYELLFRASANNVFEYRSEASTSMVVDSLMVFDLANLTGGAKAFINIDESALRRNVARLLPPDRVVVEILETVPPTPEIIQLCQELCGSGYALALDDFVGKPEWEPLVALAKFIKIDFRGTDAGARMAMIQRFRSRGAHMLAEKVETQAELEEARAFGYSHFQGYFFCKPAMISARDIPANKVVHLRLLEAVSATEFSRAAVEEILKQEPSLVYKLLRYLNSPLLGLRSEIRGVGHAISLLGEVEIRRWISIMAVAAMAADKPPELIRTALTRGYFCEALSDRLGMAAQSSNLFFMGLLSVTDAILDRPIDEILATLPISPEVRTALCGGENAFRDIYDTLLAYERGDWDSLSSAASRVGPVEAAIPACYQSAATRAAAIFS